jgi:hypothetical protein
MAVLAPRIRSARSARRLCPKLVMGPFSLTPGASPFVNSTPAASSVAWIAEQPTAGLVRLALIDEAADDPPQRAAGGVTARMFQVLVDKTRIGLPTSLSVDKLENRPATLEDYARAQNNNPSRNPKIAPAIAPPMIPER